jgi:ParB family transcriptional regulator, chromosome partitioning protein
MPGSANSRVASIALGAIDVDPALNARRSLTRVPELADSIRAHGLLQPLVVRADPGVPGRYLLVAGHRRLAALKLLVAEDSAWSQVPATVRSDGDEDTYVLTLVENLQRDDLSPREESEALARLIRQRGWTTRQVAASIKRSQAYVSKRLRVYEDRSLRALILHDRIAPTVAEELLGVNPERRVQLARRAAAERWDQRRARAEVRGYGAAFHPELRQHVAALRTLMANASLSVGERDLLQEVARQILATFSDPVGELA